MFKRSTMIALFINILLLICLVGCNQSISSETPKDSSNIKTQAFTYWQEERDTIYTNDYSRLKNFIPYTLVLPQSIPSELLQYPPQFTKYSSQINTFTGETIIDENIIEVKVNYQAFSGDYRALHIWENNSSIPLTDSDDYTEWDINGIKIHEKMSVDEQLSKLEKKDITLTKYYWYWNKLRFEASIWGYNQSEARKIIESMIE